jgi:flagellar basal-body rod protein FlgF
MDSGLYAACAGLVAKSQALEVSANNLANVNASGYRAQRSVFRSILAQASSRQLPQMNKALNSFGVMGGTRIDRSQGTLDQTGNSLDVAIEGTGLFSVATASGIQYTRNGNFHLSPSGELLTASGERVLSTQGQPIRVPSGSISISPDGILSVNGAVVAKLRMTEFPATAALQNVGNGMYSAPEAEAVNSSNSSVRQGWLEGSNVNPTFAAVELISIQRQFSDSTRPPNWVVRTIMKVLLF